MATIRQIAKDLGVSISTVSAVINKRGYVRDKLRARIEKASSEADYRPNQIARSLRLRETRNVALMVPDLSNFFYSRPMRGAEDYLAAADCRLPVVDSRRFGSGSATTFYPFPGRSLTPNSTLHGLTLVAAQVESAAQR